MYFSVAVHSDLFGALWGVQKPLCEGSVGVVHVPLVRSILVGDFRLLLHEELFDFFLITDSVVVAEASSFFILVQAFLLSLSLIPDRG